MPISTSLAEPSLFGASRLAEPPSVPLKANDKAATTGVPEKPQPGGAISQTVSPKQLDKLTLVGSKPVLDATATPAQGRYSRANVVDEHGARSVSSNTLFNRGLKPDSAGRAMLAQSPPTAQTHTAATPSSAQALQAARSTSVQVGSGSGVIVGRNDDCYYVLTNAHVVGFFNDKEKLVMPDGAELDGERVKSNSPMPMGDNSDLALVKVSAPGKNYGVAQWGAEEPAVATWATQAGFPIEAPPGSGALNNHGRGLRYVGAMITEDLQTASGEGSRAVGSYEVGLGASLTIGSSGGGTFDNHGRLIGINGHGVVGGTATAQGGGNLTLANPETQALIIDAQTAREFMKGVVPGF